MVIGYLFQRSFMTHRELVIVGGGPAGRVPAAMEAQRKALVKRLA